MKRLLRILIGAAVVAGLLVLAFFFWAWRNPFELHRITSRRALKQVGLERVRTELEGQSFVYWRGGSGPALVLLHGAGDQAGAWSRVAGRLIKEYTLLIPDLPGHGESEPLSGPLPLGRVVRGVEQFLETQEEQAPWTLAGNSLGAWLALLYAHEHPERLARVVAINGGALRGAVNPDVLAPKSREEARALMDLMLDPSSLPLPDFVLDDLVDWAQDSAMARLMLAPEAFEPYLLDGRLGEIEVPVELLWGISDRLVPLAYAERMAAELLRSRLTPIAACGHAPQMECPERFAESLLELLREEPPQPRVLDEATAAETAAATGAPP